MNSHYACRRARWLLALMLGAWLQALAAGDDEDMWHYVVQPGDDPWRIAQRYLLDPGYWHELVRLNHIDKPRALRPGTVLRIPLYWLRLERAGVRVVNMRGKITLLPARGRPRPLTSDTRFHIDDGVLLGKDASLLLEFSDGSRTLLGPNTRAFFRRLNHIRGSDYADTRVEVQKGDLQTRVPVHGTRFQVSTPAANTTVRGTRFAVGVNQAGETPVTRIEVETGRVGVANGAGRLDLPGGFGTVARPDRPPQPPVKLLPAPVLQPPAGPVRRLPVEARWSAVPGASGYRVVLSPDVPDAVPLRVTTTRRTGYSEGDVPDGRYRLEVRALDGLGLAGHAGRLSLEVDARPFPPLLTAPAAGAVLHGSGVTLRWSTPPQADGYRLQLSRDESFSSVDLDRTLGAATRLKLDPLESGAWYWRVASLYQGEQGPWSLVRRFELRPEPAVPDPTARTVDGKLQLTWQPGRPDQSYRLQVARDPGFHELLMDRRLKQPRFDLEVPTEPIYMRVKTVDADGYEGAWSPAQTLYPPPEPWYRFGLPAALILLLAL